MATVGFKGLTQVYCCCVGEAGDPATSCRQGKDYIAVTGQFRPTSTVCSLLSLADYRLVLSA